MDWIEYLDKEEWDRKRREDYYAAQIACEVARARVKDPGSLKTEDFLIKFTTRKEEQEVDEEVLAQRVEMSKAKWFGITGVGAPVPGVAPAVPTPPAPHTPGAKKVGASNGGNDTRT